jgi:hypothetical protein
MGDESYRSLGGGGLWSLSSPALSLRGFSDHWYHSKVSGWHMRRKQDAGAVAPNSTNTSTILRKSLELFRPSPPRLHSRSTSSLGSLGSSTHDLLHDGAAIKTPSKTPSQELGHEFFKAKMAFTLANASRPAINVGPELVEVSTEVRFRFESKSWGNRCIPGWRELSLTPCSN